MGSPQPTRRRWPAVQHRCRRQDAPTRPPALSHRRPPPLLVIYSTTATSIASCNVSVKDLTVFVIDLLWGFVVDNLTAFLHMSDEDMDQDLRDWEETYGGSDENFKDDSDAEKDGATTGADGDAEKDGAATGADGDAEKEKEVIDVEAEEEKKRKPMASRSSMWDHFTKIYDKGQVSWRSVDWF
ncbi:uncharacterized protein [Miscanthus floridulus]|uniref:uncharacterized protein isoform X2 n=1 Tax=Miscanthus floridulus TaxID=154761 RepID=UPI003459EE63